LAPPFQKVGKNIKKFWLPPFQKVGKNIKNKRVLALPFPKGTGVAKR